jgi:predicted ribosome quality control (RQC) complex YloA/Tae2 family protein
MAKISEKLKNQLKFIELLDDEELKERMVSVEPKAYQLFQTAIEHFLEDTFVKNPNKDSITLIQQFETTAQGLISKIVELNQQLENLSTKINVVENQVEVLKKNVNQVKIVENVFNNNSQQQTFTVLPDRDKNPHLKSYPIPESRSLNANMVVGDSGIL